MVRHFKVPADQTVYFHALDEDFLELRRMRSNVTFQAGEDRRPNWPPRVSGDAASDSKSASAGHVARTLNPRAAALG